VYYRWESQMARFDDIIAAISEPVPDRASASLKRA
jgi:hypothetical protein